MSLDFDAIFVQVSEQQGFILAKLVVVKKSEIDRINVIETAKIRIHDCVVYFCN